MDLTKLALTDLKPEEHLVTIVRHHWFILLKEAVGVLVLFLLPFIALPLIGFVVNAGSSAAETGAIAGFFGSLWALICWQILFVRWTDYYYDIWIITNWRIVDIDQRGLFRRNVASILDLDHIQDVDYELSGFIGNILNFGHFNVQTAGTRVEFDFDDAVNPQRVEKMIRDAQEELIQLKRRIGLTPHDRNP